MSDIKFNTYAIGLLRAKKQAAINPVMKNNYFTNIIGSVKYDKNISYEEYTVPEEIRLKSFIENGE